MSEVPLYTVNFRSISAIVSRLFGFRGGLEFKAHRLLYYSTLGLRVIKKKEKPVWVVELGARVEGCGVRVRRSPDPCLLGWANSVHPQPNNQESSAR